MHVVDQDHEWPLGALLLEESPQCPELFLVHAGGVDQDDVPEDSLFRYTVTTRAPDYHVADTGTTQSLSITNAALGGDPLPNVVKKLTLIYELDGNIFSQDFDEGSDINLPPI